MAKVDRSILSANDQNMGDFGDPNKLESSIAHLADTIDGNDTDISTLQTDNTSNKGRLNTLETDVSTLKSDNTSNKSKITTLEGDNATNKNRLGVLETDNASNKNRISTNESNIAYNEGRLVDLLRDNQKASEVVDARMGFPVLRDKLENVDAQLAETTNKLDKIVMVTDFDGVVQDTGDNSTDITLALQAVSDETNAYTGTFVNVHFPKGKYRITGAVDWKRTIITGDRNTTIICDGANAKFTFTPYGTNALAYETFIKDIAFKGINGADKGVHIYKGSQFYMENVGFYDFNIGLHLESTDITHIIRPTIQNCQVGILHDAVTGTTIEAGNFWNNKVDNSFKGYCGGISFTNMNYFEDSDVTFLFDNTDAVSGKPVSVSGFYVKGNMLVRNNTGVGNKVSATSYIAKFKGTGTVASLSVNNFIFEGNRIVCNFAGLDHMFDVEFTGGNTGNNLGLKVSENYLYNQMYPDGYIIKAAGNGSHQLQVIFEDNIMSSGNVNIVDGAAWITGLDRSDAKLRFFNRVRGAMILGKDPSVVPTEGGTLYYGSFEGRMRFVDKNGTTNLIPVQAAYQADSTAVDVATLKADFNSLLTKLKAAHVIKSS